MTDVEIPYPAGGGCEYMTPKLPFASAIELLAIHERTAHGQDASATVSVKPEKFPCPKVGLDERIEKVGGFQLVMATIQGRILSVRKETNETINSLLFTRLGY